MVRSVRSKAVELRIVEAAAEAFARVGYEGASVRMICQAAGVNPAAVNYHFGGKAALFAHALDHAATLGRILAPLASAKDHGTDVLRSQIDALMNALHGYGHSSWLWRIAAREAASPSERSSLVRERIVGEIAALRTSLAPSLSVRQEAQELEESVTALLAVCLNWDSARRLVGDGASGDDARAASWVAAHIGKVRCRDR